jgi:hypothetical protein
MYPRHSFND